MRLSIGMMTILMVTFIFLWITVTACLKAHAFFHVCTTLVYEVHASKKTCAYEQAFFSRWTNFCHICLYLDAETTDVKNTVNIPEELKETQVKTTDIEKKQETANELVMNNDLLEVSKEKSDGEVFDSTESNQLLETNEIPPEDPVKNIDVKYDKSLETSQKNEDSKYFLIVSFVSILKKNNSN